MSAVGPSRADARPRYHGAMYRACFAYMTAYRAEVALWLLATTLPLIMMGVWISAGDSGAFPGLTAGSAARYFLAVFIIRQVTVSWVLWEFEYDILSGKLSPRLLHPVDPVWRYLHMHLSEQAVRAPLFACVVVGVLLLYPDAMRASAQPGSGGGPGEGGGGEESGAWLWPSAVQVGLAFIATYLAFGFRFLEAYTVGLGAFWIERVAGLGQLFFLPYLFFSGLLYPLEALPESTRSLLLWTPWPYLAWFPAKLLSAGPEAFADLPIARGFLTMAAWLSGLLLLNRVLWRRARRRYTAMGA